MKVVKTRNTIKGCAHQASRRLVSPKPRRLRSTCTEAIRATSHCRIIQNNACENSISSADYGSKDCKLRGRKSKQAETDNHESKLPIINDERYFWTKDPRRCR